VRHRSKDLLDKVYSCILRGEDKSEFLVIEFTGLPEGDDSY